jgi:crotonobetainyl-CoA:carnitine CoA-transferase CaiB-like acyl-CoA transferase
MSYGLEGIKVIETASVAAGPMTGRFLADWGADVVHIDHTIRKAQMQRMRAAQPRNNMNYWAQSTGRNKRGIALNLSSDHGREIIYKMLEKADVLLSNFRPYELDKFKLDFDTLSRLNPRLICANITGFGTKGPDKDSPAYGPIAGDSRAGMLYSLMMPGGSPPQVSGTLVDYITGLSLACGISTALYTRERTGLGQAVEASLFQSMVFALSGDIANTLASGQDRGTVDRKDIARPLTSPYKTKDGRWIYLWIGMGADQVWPRFCRALGREDLVQDERFSTPAQITQNYSELYDILDEVFASKTLAEWKPRLDEGDFPWSPIQSFLEVTKDPQARANDFFIPLKMPSGESMEVVANPIKFSRISEVIPTPAPEVGQHTDKVLAEYGYSAEDIAKFREEGVVG